MQAAGCCCGSPFRSTRATRMPRCASNSASVQPVGPAPLRLLAAVQLRQGPPVQAEVGQQGGRGEPARRGHQGTDHADGGEHAQK